MGKAESLNFATSFIESLPHQVLRNPLKGFGQYNGYQANSRTWPQQKTLIFTL
jgi:hypothetical protein